jgi:hypothetical protein
MGMRNPLPENPFIVSYEPFAVANRLLVCGGAFFVLAKKLITNKKTFKTEETMKTNRKRLVAIVLCAISFTACKKEQMTPMEPMDKISNGNASLMNPAPVYTLQRRGHDSLMYYNDGRLSKVIGQFGYTVYNYVGFNTIVAKTYENGLLGNQDTYYVDVASGRCYEHEAIGYTNAPSGAIVTTNVYKFEYDAQERLSKRYKKDEPNDREMYTYDADGNLKEIKSYNKANVLVTTNLYSYSASVPKNKLKLNVEYQGLDLYLKIFGKVSKDMPQHQSTRLASSNELIYSEWLTYTMNNDGYPTNFTRFDFIHNKMNGSVDFRYKPVRKM